MNSSEALTVEEAAARLGISREMVQKLVTAGQLPAQRRAGAWWIDAGAVERRRREPPGTGRPLSGAVAWLALLLASGERETPAWRPLISHGHTRDRARTWLEANP